MKYGCYKTFSVQNYSTQFDLKNLNTNVHTKIEIYLCVIK